MHTTHDPTNLVTIESKTSQGMVERFQTHLDVNSLHIKLNGHELMIGRSSLKVIYKHLCNQALSKNCTRHKVSLLQNDQMRKNGLHLTYQNLGIDLVQGGTKTNRAIVT